MVLVFLFLRIGVLKLNILSVDDASKLPQKIDINLELIDIDDTVQEIKKY